MMRFLDRLRQAGELLDLIERIVSAARSLPEALALLHKAAERGDLDKPLEKILKGQQRARRFEENGT